jgi:leucyl-tRNA synthetase
MYGADTLRLYEMFMGPLEQVKPWNTQSVGGVHRFLSRTWSLIVNPETGNLKDSIVSDDKIAYGSTELEKNLHRLIKKVSEDLDGMKFNTAIAAFMTFLNEATDEKEIPTRIIKTFVTLIAPFAPHMAEELWEKLGGTDTITYENWPKYDVTLTPHSEVTIAVQVNGKLRSTIEVPVETSKEELLKIAKSIPKIQDYLEGKSIVKEIAVPGRLINFVVK